MLVFENIMLALSGLKANKMRALLTMLGIIIGIASVIAIMTVGNSLSTSITTSMQDMGANDLTVGVKQKSTSQEVTRDGMRFGAGKGRSMSEEDYITEEMLTAYEQTYAENIKCISLTESVGSAVAEDGEAYANISITGVNDGFLEANDLTLLAGRSLTERDQEEGRKVVLVSDKLVSNLFDGDAAKAVGSTIEAAVGSRYYTYTIVGVYEYEDSAFSSDSEYDTTTDVYLPLLTAKNQTHATDGYSQLTVVSATGTDTETFLEETENFFNRYYSRNEYYEVSVTSMESMLSSMTSMLTTVSLAIAVIAGISLLVGGIGVMNIMLVSITERTREIGTRKALGATNGSIRLQFIMESVVICLLGGAIGIILGLTLGSIATKMLGYAAKASVVSIVFSVVFSIFIGVFFGYYPANKAAKLNPIEALRYE